MSLKVLRILCIVMSITKVFGDQHTFQYCIKSQPNPGLINCAGRQAISALQRLQEKDNYTVINGFVMIKDENLASRSVPNFLDQDPMDFRGILENAGAIIGQRTLQWDLGIIEPGLCLRIGPSVESTSMLEFIMDPNHDRGDRYIHEEPSTARILAKQFLLPFLLGLKFNLITILPLFFAGIILLCKKAAFLGKIALFVFGLLGYGSAFSLGGLTSGFGGFGGGYGGGGVGGFQRPIFDSISVSNIGNGPINHDYPGASGGAGIGLGGGGYYRTERADKKKVENTLPLLAAQTEQEELLNDHFYNYEKKVLLQDRNTKLYEKDLEADDRSGYRNFAWKTN